MPKIPYNTYDTNNNSHNHKNTLKPGVVSADIVCRPEVSA